MSQVLEDLSRNTAVKTDFAEAKNDKDKLTKVSSRCATSRHRSRSRRRGRSERCLASTRPCRQRIGAQRQGLLRRKSFRVKVAAQYGQATEDVTSRPQSLRTSGCHA